MICWFCDQKGHTMFTCEKFKAAKGKNEEANLACDLEESDNWNLDELCLQVWNQNDVSCDMILNIGCDTLFVEITFGCDSHFSDERALKYKDTVCMKYSEMIHKAKKNAW